MAASDIVKKLWALCDILRDSGVNYSDYLNELVMLMFLKMVQEQLDNELLDEDPLPEGCHWSDIKNLSGIELLNTYRQILEVLSGKTAQLQGRQVTLSPKAQAIYADAATTIREPRSLETLIKSLDELDWFSADRDELGNAYEGLLEKNAGETKSGAGQYFTPRVLINCMVSLVKPQAGEIIQDPAAGTGGFILAAHQYIKEHTDGLLSLDGAAQEFQKKDAFEAVELVPGTRRMALMNCLLHSLPGRGEGVVHLGNSLGAAGAALSPADVILTNPPFGTARGSGITRSDLPFKTSNKQLAFLEHICRGLKPGGRAAVVFPDNVLFEDGVGRQIRIDLMDRCTLHTILRLPTGIFYAAGVQANVLFFTRGTKDNPLQDEGCTTGVWVYDLRTNMPSFGKTSPFTSEYLKPFAQVFGTDPYGQSARQEGEWSFTQGEHTAENNRWRCFSRKWIKEHNDESLNISWVKDQDLAQDLADVDLDELIGQAQTEAGEIVKLLEALKSAAAAQQGSPA